ncbi:PQQ-binding-like beta-propeller repeat protein [Haloferax namakaokahaiae]|uniref:PQQ-binding-like beta-propeller repeat protein n=1 Tax=Haloferax namakaokahaiae TaxID=1748331 RepID=A0ABD5ZBS0_9EURY
MPSSPDSADSTDSDVAESEPTGDVVISRRVALGGLGGALALGGVGGYVLGARPFESHDCETTPFATEADEWPFPNYDRRHTSAAPARAAPETLEEQWHVEWDADLYGRPVVANDRIFVGEAVTSDREVLHAFDLRTGESLWTTEFEGSNQRFPLVAVGDAVYFHTNTDEDGRTVNALAVRDGTTRWTYSFDELGSVPPLVPAEGMLLLEDPSGGGPGTPIMGIDARSGERCWEANLGTDSLLPTPAVADGRVYFTAWERYRYQNDDFGYLFGVNPTAGEVTFEATLPRGVGGPPLIGDGIAYVTAGSLVAISLDTGEPLWRDEQTELFTTGKTSTQIAHPSYELGALTSDVLVTRLESYTSASDRVRAFEPQTGEMVWERVAAGKDTEITSPTAAGDEVFFVENRRDDSPNRLVRLDASSGETIETVSLSSPVQYSPIFAEGFAVLATYDGIYAFGPE